MVYFKEIVMDINQALIHMLTQAHDKGTHIHYHGFSVIPNAPY